MNGVFNDLNGQRFGRLRIIGRGPPGTYGRVRWRTICDCGTEIVRTASALTRGRATSCGCGRFVHDMINSPEYSSWRAMMKRCTDPNNLSYPRYGGRGIAVCDRWRDSFTEFFADMGRRPRGHSIDRIDIDGNYEPSNCRWATYAAQMQHTSFTKIDASTVLEIRGRIEHGESQASVARRLGMSTQRISQIWNRKAWASIS